MNAHFQADHFSDDLDRTISGSITRATYFALLNSHMFVAVAYIPVRMMTRIISAQLQTQKFNDWDLMPSMRHRKQLHNIPWYILD